MRIRYSLDQEDFLTYQYYMATQNPKVKRVRLIKRFLLPVLFLVIGIILLALPATFVSFVLWGLALIWIIIFPFWHKKRLRQGYLSFIKKNYSQRLGKEVVIDIRQYKIMATESGYKLKLKGTDIKAIEELAHLILIKINTKQHIIIPKQKIENTEQFIKVLRAFSEDNEVTFEMKLNL